VVRGYGRCVGGGRGHCGCGSGGLDITFGSVWFDGDSSEVMEVRFG